MPLSLVRVAPLLLLALALPARAEERERPPFEVSDIWSEPYQGVRYLRRTTTAPCTIHVLEIDLRAEGVEVETSDPETRWQTVREQANQGGYVAAINGGFWHNTSTPAGLHVHDGAVWERSEDDGLHGTLIIDDRGRARISYPEEVIGSLPASLRFATSGRPSIVREGELDVGAIDPIGTANLRQPRSAAGVDRRGRTLWLVVTDGRSELSKGMTLYELGRLLAELGAERALNLDGGGSSTLFVEGLGGVANAPSGGRWESALGLGVELRSKVRRRRRRGRREYVYLRGVQREVIDVIGIRAREPNVASVVPPTLAGPEVMVLPPRAPTIRLRWGYLAMEWILRWAPWLGVLMVVALGLKVLRRIAASKRRTVPISDLK